MNFGKENYSGPVDETETTFTIPATAAEIEDLILDIQEQLDIDEENMEKKKNGAYYGVPEEFLPEAVRESSKLHNIHAHQLELLRAARKKAA